MIRTAMIIILGLGIFTYGLLGFVLNLHWKNYADNSRALLAVQIIYGIVGISILGIISLSYLSYTPL